MMKIRICHAVLGCLWLTTSCSGREIDIGNGAEGVTGSGGQTATAGGGSTEPVGTGNGSMSAATTTGNSSMSAATTTGNGSMSAATTTGNSSMSAVTTTGNSSMSAVTTTGGGASGAGGLPSAGGSGGDGPIPPGPASAIVMRYADIPKLSGSTGSTTTGGPAIDPDLPFIFVGNGPPTCSDPFGGPACDRWTVSIGIPASLLGPGVFSLNDPRLVSGQSVRGPDRGGGDCYGGGGTFYDGRLEIAEVGTSLLIRLADTTIAGFDANGWYTVARCP
jgi:hypothetical protein